MSDFRLNEYSLYRIMLLLFVNSWFLLLLTELTQRASINPVISPSLTNGFNFAVHSNGRLRKFSLLTNLLFCDRLKDTEQPDFLQADRFLNWPVKEYTHWGVNT